MLMQAYDFLSLHDRHGCRLQIGGSDQWGNITAGIDLVRRLRGKEVYGLTMPLVTNAAGQKFGKSEKGNVWLDPTRTSPYDFYQFFFRVDDRDVGRFLRYFTFLDEAAIVALDERCAVGAGEARGAADAGARGDQARARRRGGARRRRPSCRRRRWRCPSRSSTCSSSAGCASRSRTRGGRSSRAACTSTGRASTTSITSCRRARRSSAASATST